MDFEKDNIEEMKPKKTEGVECIKWFVLAILCAVILCLGSELREMFATAAYIVALGVAFFTVLAFVDPCIRHFKDGISFKDEVRESLKSVFRFLNAKRKYAVFGITLILIGNIFHIVRTSGADAHIGGLFESHSYVAKYKVGIECIAGSFMRTADLPEKKTAVGTIVRGSGDLNISTRYSANYLEYRESVDYEEPERHLLSVKYGDLLLTFDGVDENETEIKLNEPVKASPSMIYKDEEVYTVYGTNYDEIDSDRYPVFEITLTDDFLYRVNDISFPWISTIIFAIFMMYVLAWVIYLIYDKPRLNQATKSEACALIAAFIIAIPFIIIYGIYG